MKTTTKAQTQTRRTHVAAVNRARVDLLDATDAMKTAADAAQYEQVKTIRVVTEKKGVQSSAQLTLIRTLVSIVFDYDTRPEELTSIRDALRAAQRRSREVRDYAVAEALTGFVASMDDCIAMSHNRIEARRVELAVRNAAIAAGVK